MASFNIQNGSAFGVSDILIVRPNQVITDTDVSRFREIHIKDDPNTGERGSLVINDGGVATAFKSDDLIVGADMTVTDANDHNNILILPGNTLTIS